MTEQNLTIYEQAVTTDRPAEMLARMHGFADVAQLAESLAPHAYVLDLGAGASPFGKEVATLRPDITWINFDYSYHNPAILEEVTKDAPVNLYHVFGDATKLSDTYETETFDAVFSYWLLPHLSIDNLQPAKDSARAIFATAKLGGLMSVGPKSSQKRLPTLKPEPAIQIIKNEGLDAVSYAEIVVAETKLSKGALYRQRLANNAATPFFGTTRYTKRSGRVPKIYHPQSGEYVTPFSRKGVRTFGSLAVAVARHASNQSK
jgi:hypothetical protein